MSARSWTFRGCAGDATAGQGLGEFAVDCRRSEVDRWGAGAVAFLIAVLVSSVPVWAQPMPTPPALLNSNGTTDSGGDFKAQITTDGAGNWVAVWETDVVGDFHILGAISTDNGVSWTAPSIVGDGTFLDNFKPQVATDGSGTWVVVWEATDIGTEPAYSDGDVFRTYSTDNGATWAPWMLLNANGEVDSGFDFVPQVTTDGSGNWVAVWASTENLVGPSVTDPNILVARSTDKGASWSSPALLNTNGDTDVGLDLNPQIRTNAIGTWVAVWQSTEDLNGTAGTDNDIFVARSTDNGLNWTAPAPLNTNAATDSGNDEFPQLATDGVGNWVAVWISEENLNGTAGVDADVFVARSSNNGTTWSAPALLNANGTSDSESDIDPQVTTDGSGEWLAVWQSPEDLGGTAGTDLDIFVARSTDNGANWTAPALLLDNATTDVGDDQAPQLTTDGLGTWLAVWQSNEDLNGTAGTDADIFVSTVLAPGPLDTVGDISSSSDPDFVRAGDYLELTAPSGSNYQWKKDNVDLAAAAPRLTGVNSQVLVFNPVFESDAGVYTVVYDDGTAKVLVESEPFVLAVLGPGALPAAGAAALGVLFGCIAVLMIARARRRS